MIMFVSVRTLQREGMQKIGDAEKNLAGLECKDFQPKLLEDAPEQSFV
jgi:hypothetical protein